MCSLWESSWNYPLLNPALIHGKFLSSMKPVPGAKKMGNCFCRMGVITVFCRQKMNSHIPGSCSWCQWQTGGEEGFSVPKSFLWKTHTYTFFFFLVDEEGAKFCVWAEKVLSRVYMWGHRSPGWKGGPENVSPWNSQEGLWNSNGYDLQGGTRVNFS